MVLRGRDQRGVVGGLDIGLVLLLWWMVGLEAGPSWDDPLYKATTSRIEKINYDGCVYAITWFRVG